MRDIALMLVYTPLALSLAAFDGDGSGAASSGGSERAARSVAGGTEAVCLGPAGHFCQRVANFRQAANGAHTRIL